MTRTRAAHLNVNRAASPSECRNVVLVPVLNPAVSQPSLAEKTTPKRARRPVEDDYEDYDSSEDEYDDDSYEDYDEGRSGGGGRSRSGRSSGRSAKRFRSGSAKHKLQTGLLGVAISTCFYAAIVFIKLLVLFDSASSGSVSALGKGHLWLNFLGITGIVAGYIVCLLGPDKGCRNLNIAALATGVIAVGLVFFMQILPALDGGAVALENLCVDFLR